MSVVELQELDEVKGLLAKGQQVGVLSYAEIGKAMSELDLDESDVEELHGVLVELATGTDCTLGEEQRPIVLAAREAMTNAAKFSGSDEISVYAEAQDNQISVFVRDRGVGFDRDVRERAPGR